MTLPLQHPELPHTKLQKMFWSSWCNVYFDQDNREHRVSYGVERNFVFERTVFIKIGVNLDSVAQSQSIKEGAALKVSRFQGSLSGDEQFLLAK